MCAMLVLMHINNTVNVFIYNCFKNAFLKTLLLRSGIETKYKFDPPAPEWVISLIFMCVSIRIISRN